MIFGINTTCDISKLSQISYNNFEISLEVFMPNITTTHAITYTNKNLEKLPIFDQNDGLTPLKKSQFLAFFKLLFL